MEKENIAVERLATMEARANFNKDTALRNWIAKRGGVYVQINRGTPPNPYLDHIPERDIQTTSGKQLTLVNPAYLLRQTMNEFSELYGIKGSITSLKPLNKINEPDEWESKVLHAFDRGELDEKWEVGDINGEPHLRYMQAFYTKKSCLKCHKHQGYQVGDVRGGVGVSIPLTPYIEVKSQTIRNLKFSYSTIWLLGIIGIGFVNHFTRQHITQQQESKEALSVSKERFQDLVESTTDWIWELDNKGNFTYASPRVKELLGYEPEELVGKMTGFDLMSPREAEAIKKEYNSFIAAAEPFYAMANINLHKDGHEVVMESSGRPFFDARGKLLGYRGIDRDITYRKRAEELLKESEKKYRRLIDGLGDKHCIFSHTPEGIFSYASPGFRALFGKEPEKIIGKSWRELGFTDDSTVADDKADKRIQNDNTSEGNHFETVILNCNHPDGSVKIIEIAQSPVFQGDCLVAIEGICADITERKQAEKELEKILCEKGERVKELQCMYGVAESIRNRATLEELFQDVANIIPLSWHYPEITRGKVTFEEKEYVSESFEETEWEQSCDILVNNKPLGSIKVFYLEETPELDEGPFMVEERNLIEGIAKNLSESIEKRGKEEELIHMATRDPLTGLYNHNEMQLLLNDEIERASRYKHPLSIFMLDLDHFKSVNDTYGHQSGDIVLQHLAKILESTIRTTDYAARYGGEEFLVILPETPLSETKNLAERLCSKIAENSIKIQKNKVLNVTASIGIATFLKHAKSQRDLLDAADVAMYTAKKNGRNRVHTADNS
ncbi:MAG: diguanylate cyclase [Gammaproteobacteria bacterium]|nr:diguanylate cyclase [Gammaproteobacteria bacterium]